MRENKSKKYELIISGCILLLLIVIIRALFRVDLMEPAFSVPGGFYDSEFELELACTNPNLKIYYTVDGTMPDRNSIEYTGPILVYDYSVNENVYSIREDVAFEEAKFGYVWIPTTKVRKATVVKAIAYNEYDQSSKIVTETYFIGNDYGELPVISITLDPESLYGYEDGIYIKGKIYDDWYEMIEGNITPGGWGYPSNMQLTGSAAERSAKIEFMCKGKKVFEQQVGIRVRGGATRYFEQKSFSIYARDKYGRNKINYELFPQNISLITGDSIVEYESFIIRNWGNSYRTHMFVDPLVQTLVRERDIATQYSRTCVVYLNGEYWGLYDMKEKFDEEFFFQHYGILKDNLIVVKYQATADKTGRAVVIGDQSDIQEYETLESFIQDYDLSKEENYEILCSLMDINSFIDLYAIRMYVEAVDFPLNNVSYWKSKTIIPGDPYQDGKWRLALLDVDPDLNHPNYYDAYDLFEQNSVTFRKLLTNPEFRKLFVVTLCDLMNETFAYDKVENALMNMYNESLPYIEEYYERYGPQGIEEGAFAKREYFTQKNNETLDFFYNQKEYIQNIIKEKGLVSGDLVKVTVSLNPIYGKVQINSVTPDFDQAFWEGEYYTDYPISLKVIPDEGREFLGWYDSEDILLSKDFQLMLDLDKDTYIKALFQ